jgi:hypothetical protein
MMLRRASPAATTPTTTTTRHRIMCANPLRLLPFLPFCSLSTVFSFHTTHSDYDRSTYSQRQVNDKLNYNTITDKIERWG